MKQCPQCQAQVDDNAVFCPNCGYSATAQNQPPPVAPVKKNKLLLPLAIVGGVISLCAICGVIGGIEDLLDKNKANQTSVASTTPSPSANSSSATISNSASVTSTSTPMTTKTASPSPSPTPPPQALWCRT